MPVFMEFRRRDIEAQVHILTGRIARVFNGLEDDLHGRLVRRQVRGKAALVTDRRTQPTSLQYPGQGMKDLGTAAQRLGKRRQAHRQNHELLHVHAVVRVGAAVDDVHHGHGHLQPARLCQACQRGSPW